MTTDEQAALQAAWRANYPDGAPAPTAPALPPHLVVLALGVLSAAFGPAWSGLGIMVDMMRFDREPGATDVSELLVLGYPLSGPMWAVVVTPLGIATLVAAWRYLRSERGWPLPAAVLAWAGVLAFLDAPWNTRLVLVLVSLVAAGALLNASHTAGRDAGQRRADP